MRDIVFKYSELFVRTCAHASPTGPRVFVIKRAGGNAKTTINASERRRCCLRSADVGVPGVVLQFGELSHENVVIEDRNIWVGLIICADFRAQFANTIKSGRAAPFGDAHRES